jgi:hypothetical protein
VLRTKPCAFLTLFIAIQATAPEALPLRHLNTLPLISLGSNARRIPGEWSDRTERDYQHPDSNKQSESQIAHRIHFFSPLFVLR